MSGQTSRVFKGERKYRLRSSVFFDEPAPKNSTKFIGNTRADLGFEPATERRKRQTREDTKRGKADRVPHAEIAADTADRLRRNDDAVNETWRAEKMKLARAELENTYKARFL